MPVMEEKADVLDPHVHAYVHTDRVWDSGEKSATIESELNGQLQESQGDA